MAYLANRAINRLNIHSGIMTAASASGGAFVAAYLLKAGVSVPMVLCAYALIRAGRFAVRPAVLMLGKRLGLRALIMTGAVVIAAEYPVLAQTKGLDLWLLALCLITAVGESLYSTAYHAYFAALGDAEHRGHQTSAREAVNGLSRTLAPIACGWGLVALGPQITFGMIAVVQLMSVIPLLGAPQGAVEPLAPGAWRAAMRAAPIYLADGWMSGMGSVLWLAALFVTLSQSYAAYGGAMAAAALVGILFGLFLGKNIDRGHGTRIVWITFGLVMVSYTSRVIGVTPTLAVLANTIGAVVGFFYVPTLLTAAYNLSKAAPCQFRFQFVGESAWDVGCAAGCLVAAGAIWAGAPIHGAILLCFVGVAGSFLVLRRYYAGLAVTT
ncbi:MAG: hypothetical protein U1E50_02435 [Caulobacteraceae bacterium]